MLVLIKGWMGPLPPLIGGPVPGCLIPGMGLSREVRYRMEETSPGGFLLGNSCGTGLCEPLQVFCLVVLSGRSARAEVIRGGPSLKFEASLSDTQGSVIAV